VGRKVRIKDYGWFVGVVYDSKELPKVTTIRPRVARVLQHWLQLS
jgi:hypothetical protein